MTDLKRIICEPPTESIAALDAARAPDSPLAWIASLHAAAERIREPGPSVDLAAGMFEDHWDREWAEEAIYAEPARALAAQSPDKPSGPRSYVHGPWRLTVDTPRGTDAQITLHGRAPVVLQTATGAIRLRPGQPATIPAAELSLPLRIRLPDGRLITLE
ncbi:MAG: hypothetical protein ACI8S6_003502 [Myxococcota bacterium]|jgi:hypothetical protein